MPNAINNPSIKWSEGTAGFIDNGKTIGIINGKGKLAYNICGAHISGDAATNEKGEITYSNVKNVQTTGEYTDEAGVWNPGVVIGSVNDGKDIGIISGKRKTQIK